MYKVLCWMVDDGFIKVKCYTNQKIPSSNVRVKVTFTLERTMKAQRESRGVALHLNLSAR